MSITPLFVSFAAVAAFIPLTRSGRPSWLRRFQKRTASSDRSSALERTTESGWTLIRCDDLQSFRDWLGRDEGAIRYDRGEEPSLGSHLLVELFGCEEQSLKQESVVENVMRTAADESQATVVAQSFHEFKPYGVSGAVIIQESHYTIHTWPEHRYAAVDLFYCGGTIHVNKAIDVLIDRFKPERMKFLVVRRGIQSEVSKGE